MNEPLHEAPSPGNNFLIRLVIGLLLLLPAIMVYREVQILPALRTIEMSQQDVDPIRSSSDEFVGGANFEALFRDNTFAQVMAYTGLMVAIRLLIVAIIPPLIGLLIGSQAQGGRLFNRVFLAIIGVLISPVMLAVLWVLFISPVWGREASPLDPVPEWMMLGTAEGARRSVIFLDALVTMGLAVTVGGVAFIAVMRGRALGISPQRAGIGVWLIGLLMVAASLGQTFEIPFVVTNGGPGRATTTLGLYIYEQGFRFMRMGPGAAQAVFIILIAVVIACLIWLIMTGLRLRLQYVRNRNAQQDEYERRDRSFLSLISIPLLILIGLTSAALIVWAVWLAQRTGGFADASAEINTGPAFLNTISGPWTAIWFIQIPVTYLAALSLGFFKPINRVFSQLMFLILLVIAFIPAEALTMSWYMLGREAGIVNTLPLVGFAWRVGAFSLIMFKLFFEGAAEKYNAARENGLTTNDAFFKMVLLPSIPIVVLVGAVLCFASAQSFFWPLIVINDPELMGLPVQLVMMRSSALAQQGVFAGVALNFIGLITLIFLPIFLLLHVFVLDRLAIVAGPPVDSELLMGGKQKMKRDESLSERNI